MTVTGADDAVGDRQLPMFPLGSVLLPTTVLPLRIFEPRYQALIADVLAGSHEFGVTMIERGFEVGGDDVRSDVGCIAQVLDAEEQGDGLWHLVAVGTRRFIVDEWLPDDPYPRARITTMPEPAATPADDELYAEAQRQLETIMVLRSELTLPTFDIPDLAEDAALGSYQVASLAPLGSFDRQQILREATPGERLRRILELLTDTEGDLRAQLRIG